MASIISAGTTSGTSLNLSGDTSGVLQLATNGSTTAVTVDTSQRVGIGTTTSSAGGLLTLNRAPTAAFGSPILQIGGSSYTSGGYYSIGLGFTDATYTEPPAEIAYVPTSDSGGTLGSIVFGTRSVTTNTAVTERMRITSGGDVLVGTTTSRATLTVESNIRVGSSAATSGISSASGVNIVCGSGSYSLVCYDDNTLGTANFSVSRTGALAKASGSFKIEHPLPTMAETHHLVHSFVESPQADLIYRGKAQLVNGRAVVNIDEAAGMTDGTFVLLNRDVQCFTSNETDWDAVRGSVSGNILTIECQNAESTATISWLVIGERQDKHMYDTDWTDENGKVIVEPLKEIAEVAALKGVN